MSGGITALVHVVVLFIAVVPARELVALLLELPPDDFDVLVALLTAVFYLFIWSLLLGIVALTVSICVFLLGIASNLLPTPKARFLSQYRLFSHSVGLVVIAFGLIIFSEIGVAKVQNVKGLLSVVALVTEYQYIRSYPGVDSERRAKLHANGIVSYADWSRQGSVKITVEKIPESMVRISTEQYH